MSTQSFPALGIWAVGLVWLPLLPWLAMRTTAAPAPPMMASYRIEALATPAGLDPQVGALGPISDGRLAVAFHRGEVCFYDPRSSAWTVFARGLHEPLGLLAVSSREVLVMQRPELTRLRDTDGDGSADLHETVWDGFGMTGNYHEFAYGPVADRDGGLFVSLNLASTGDGVRDEIRGAWAPFGLSHDAFLHDWEGTKARISKMYSRVRWRGWVMRLGPGSSAAEPWSSGWRSPDAWVWMLPVGCW